MKKLCCLLLTLALLCLPACGQAGAEPSRTTWAGR